MLQDLKSTVKYMPKKSLFGKNKRQIWKIYNKNSNLNFLAIQEGDVFNLQDIYEDGYEMLVFSNDNDTLQEADPHI